MSVTNTLNLIRLSDGLRSADPESLVREYSGAFQPSHDSLPIIICALNEQKDLPATLAALAISELDVHPIIVDNGSDDNTAQIAMKMGARVLYEGLQSKTAAFQTGLQFVETETSAKTILSTDADTITGRHWAHSMQRVASFFSDENGGLAFGLTIVRHGTSRYTDYSRTALLNTRQVIASIRASQPGSRGNNMVIKLDNEGRIMSEILKIPPLTFPGADRAQRDAVVEAGGAIRAHIDLDGAVVTRGDRFNNMAQYISLQLGLITPSEHYGTKNTNEPHPV